MTEQAVRIQWPRIRQRPLLPRGPRGWRFPRRSSSCSAATVGSKGSPAGWPPARIAPQVPQPDAIVHLRASRAALLQRIGARSRSFERDVAPAYLSRLITAYDAFFENVDTMPVDGVIKQMRERLPSLFPLREPQP